MMKEKMRRFKKLGITAAAFTAAMVMSTATAMAWDNNGTGNAEAGEDIVIGKSLKMPANWEPATLDIQFTVAPAGFSKDGTNYTTVDGLTFEGDTVSLSKTDFSGKVDAKEQVKYWGAETGDLVDKISYKGKTGLEAIAAVAEDQKSTGAVKFTVTETKFEYTVADNTTSVSSEASYDLVFWIDYVVNEDGSSSYKVTSITDTKTKNDNGSDANQKVDPTPESTDVTETTYDQNGKITSKSDADLSYDLSGMLFNNDITKSDEPDTPNDPKPDNNAFKLTKTNVGGDQNQEFEFTVTLTAPELAGVEDGKKITVKIYDKDDQEVKTVEFVYGENKIKLKGGEKAVFGQMYNSTKVEITETGTPSYVPSYKGTYGNSDKITVNAGGSLTMNPYGISKAETDEVNYTNTYQSLTPTGIIMNNLPFFMMIVIAAFAVAATFVFGARRKVSGRK